MPQYKDIETCHYQEYFVQLQKITTNPDEKGKTSVNLARKQCPTHQNPISFRKSYMQ